MNEEFDFEDIIRLVEANDAQKLDEDQKDEQRCQECGGELEERDGLYYCSICQIQAQDIQLTVEGEGMFDAEGNIIHTQRIAQQKRERAPIDHGPNWSTDEAFNIILRRQVEFLERNKLVSSQYSKDVEDLWFLYFKKYISHVYNDTGHQIELVRERDISVIIEGLPKVDVPEKMVRVVPNQSHGYRVGNYRLLKQLDNSYHESPLVREGKEHEEEQSPSELEPERCIRSVYEPEVLLQEEPDQEEEDIVEDGVPKGEREYDMEQLSETFNEQSGDEIGEQIDEEIQESEEEPGERVGEPEERVEESGPVRVLTRNFNSTTIKIMTLAKTLGFLEAIFRTRRAVIFASDLSRWADQGTLPYHDSRSYLPADWKLNHADRLTFLQTASPKPTNISHTASHILNILCDTFVLPIPNQTTVLKRLLIDMNLPCTEEVGLLNLVLQTVNFDDLKEKMTIKLGSNRSKVPNIPQFDRWASAMIILTLKRYFVLDGVYELSISEICEEHNSKNSTNHFVFKRWLEQSYTRLKLINHYHVGHYKHDIGKMETSTFSQLYAKEANRWLTTTSIRKNIKKKQENDVNRQRDLKHFLMSAIPVQVDKNTDNTWEKPSPSLTPLTDAYNRVSAIGKKVFHHENLEKDFKDTSMCLYTKIEKNVRSREIRDAQQWSFSIDQKGVQFKSDEKWSFSFRHLLEIAGFLCYCNPEEILRELRQVERVIALKSVAKSARRKIHNVRDSSNQTSR